MCKKLILTWQSPQNRRWFVVGKLNKKNNTYNFWYTNGAIKAKEHGFLGFTGMNNFDEVYSSEQLFPIFQNRVLNKSRPERLDFLEWLNIPSSEYSDFEELARTGGIRITDNVQLYPVPENTNGKYEVTFFAHGLRHLAPHFHERVTRLHSGEKLYLCLDKQNENDQHAIMLRTSDPVEFVGYCPKFFAKDFNFLLKNTNDAKIEVSKVNPTAPEQLRLLCKFTSSWPDHFEAFNRESYKSIVDVD